MLKVFWEKECCGQISRDSKGRLSFEYTASWIESRNIPISISMPCKVGLQPVLAVRAFFENLLPENESRARLAFNHRFDKKDVLAFLSHFGEDCAGALAIVPDDKVPDFTPGCYQSIDNDLKDVLDLKASDPKNYLVFEGFQEARLSLAGAQDKLPVYYKEDKFYIPKSAGSPTSHILKPYNPTYHDLPRNEAFCMDLARKIGLNVPKSELINFGGHELFMVERFDRKGVGILLERVHQEDFCQALGVGVDQKYQDKGGPGYKDCFSIAEQYISDDIVNIKKRFTEAMLFNLIIGNNDAHGKNFSITHIGNGSIKMAPLYDLVSTEVYPNLAMKTAMSIGKTFKVEKIGSHSFREFAKDMKVSLSFVVDTAEDLLCQVEDNIESVIHSHQTKNGECEIYDKLQGIIAKNSQILTTNLEIDLDSRLGIR